MHPLIDALGARHGFTAVDERSLDDVAGPLDMAMLVICGNPQVTGEALDLAVVAPELLKAFGDRVTGLVATPQAERHFQMRFGFSLFPALIFLRNGQYLGTLTRMRDWPEYMVEIPEILQRQASPPPQFELARGCGNLQAAPH
ncbi:hydrogenase-1 expression HyaE [Dongia sp.]|uniref:hydrogenase-1 expression HyaE n=1 Tax=Dongia sp. TaxID=1977262 RepID=UPI0035B2ABEF